MTSQGYTREQIGCFPGQRKSRRSSAAIMVYCCPVCSMSTQSTRKGGDYGFVQ
jgi:hypothetical protein